MDYKPRTSTVPGLHFRSSKSLQGTFRIPDSLGPTQIRQICRAREKDRMARSLSPGSEPRFDGGGNLQRAAAVPSRPGRRLAGGLARAVADHSGSVWPAVILVSVVPRWFP